jgi:type IV secretion system protein VirB5
MIDHRCISVPLAAALLASVATTASAQFGGIVHDPMSLAQQGVRHAKELAELGKQLDALKEQLGEAKRLYESFNKITDANSVASPLNRDEFRRYLPKEFADIEKLLAGNGGESALSGLVDGYLKDNRYYSGSSSGAEDFYRQELERIARGTGAKHSIGQQVYDTAARRIDGLEQLRNRISATSTAAEKLDLSNRLQAETALLQNEVLRMQGLAMVQQARTDMDAQRERERRQKTADEMKAAVQ